MDRFGSKRRLAKRVAVGEGRAAPRGHLGQAPRVVGPSDKGRVDDGHGAPASGKAAGEDRNGPPVVSTALERGDPQLRGLEVDVARSKRERLAHAAPGERERAGERLHRRLAVGADRGEEARALLGRQVLPPAGVDELAGVHRVRRLGRWG